MNTMSVSPWQRAYLCEMQDKSMVSSLLFSTYLEEWRLSEKQSTSRQGKSRQSSRCYIIVYKKSISSDSSEYILRSISDSILQVQATKHVLIFVIVILISAITALI
mmetsp:Transcript_7318/g.10682  ORF Transcript_7318/g.10682 Transcript_7318/m.10682 type:complete len:106 (+) Transcript_7318:106-423(+)